jgi:hypothetical protein
LQTNLRKELKSKYPCNVQLVRNNFFGHLVHTLEHTEAKQEQAHSGGRGKELFSSIHFHMDLINSVERGQLLYI